MIVALISDIHGNLPALKAVLKDIEETKAKQIWCMGDLVGYMPYPNECIELIQKKASASIIGNYDQKVIGFAQKKNEWKKTKKQAKFNAFQWNSQHLNPGNEKYLHSLPQNVKLKIGKFNVLITHGSPQSIAEPIYPKTHRERLVELGKIADTDIIVTGHTHQFMNRKVGKQCFINPGSVGLPVKKDLRASYVLLEISGAKIKVTERKIQYDISEVIKGLKEANLSSILSKMIKLEYGIDIQNYIKSSSIKVKLSTNNPERVLKAIRQLAQEYNYEKQHSEHVTSLALNLFDELKPLHKLINEDRLLLNCASILHDIGWVEGQKGHNKTSMKIILNSQTLPLTDKQLKMTALIARYHRKALPKDSHPLFSHLPDKNKEKIRILAGILRIADGLDRTHTCAVKSVECNLSGNCLIVKCQATRSSAYEIEAAYKKSDLLKLALDKNIQFVVI